MTDNETKKMVQEIHTVIVGSIDGKPGLLERIRNLENFKTKLVSIVRTSIGLIITNLVTIIILILKLY
jgi:hypothetical protein